MSIHRLRLTRDTVRASRSVMATESAAEGFIVAVKKDRYGDEYCFVDANSVTIYVPPPLLECTP